MNLRDRMPLRDSDRSPHNVNEHDGCLPLAFAYLILMGSALVAVIITHPWK